jgi:hypothetical protein
MPANKEASETISNSIAKIVALVSVMSRQKKAPLARRSEKYTSLGCWFVFLDLSCLLGPQDADTALHRVGEM